MAIGAQGTWLCGSALDAVADGSLNYSPWHLLLYVSESDCTGAWCARGWKCTLCVCFMLSSYEGGCNRHRVEQLPESQRRPLLRVWPLKLRVGPRSLSTHNLLSQLPPTNTLLQHHDSRTQRGAKGWARGEVLPGAGNKEVCME